MKPRGGMDAAASQFPPAGGIGVVGDRSVDRPADRGAEQVDLIDGLRGTHPTELRRPIGGAHQHREVGEPRLDHRRMQIDRSRTARAQHQRHPTIGGEAERHERSRTLVEDRVAGHPIVSSERERERRTPRTRRDHGVLETAHHPLVDQGRAEGRVRRHGPDDTSVPGHT